MVNKPSTGKLNMNKKNHFVICGLLLGALAVIIGAFGAHSIGDRISAKSLSSYETAVKYQFYHALLMLIIGFNKNQFDQKKLQIIQWFLFLGILFFSGSIYLLATRSLTGITGTLLGPVTPIGGILLIMAWLFLIFAYQSNSNEKKLR